MSYQTSDFSGDDEYCINCIGDAVLGDDVSFDRAIFTGSYKKPKFAGFERVIGKIVGESYGAAKQQHTFTIQLPDGSKTMIKGRNLYANGVFRKSWADESARHAALDEKHVRGDSARRAREIRKSESPFY